MKRKLLKKMLLVAACLLTGTSVWAGILTPSAGLANNSTAWNTWDEGFTQNYTMSGNGTATFTFHYTADVTASDYAGWTMFIGKTINTTNVWDTWITCRGYDGTYYGGTVSGTRASSNTYGGTLSAASCTEADVVMTITRAAGVITAVAAVDPTNGDPDYSITWTYTYDGSEDATKDLYISFAVEKAYLSISNVAGPNIITTTQADINFTNDIADGAIAGVLNSISVVSGTTTATEKNSTNNSLKLGKSTSTVTIPAAIRAGSRDKVTISFDLAYGKLNNRSVFFNAKDADGTLIFDETYNVYGNTFSANTLNVSDGDFYHANNTVIWARRATYTIVIDYAANTISTSVKNNFGGAVANHQVTLTNSNPVATFNVGSNYDSNEDRRCEISNIKISTTLGDYSVSEVSYTVKFVDNNGATVKADDTSRSALAGTDISTLATTDDKTTFYNDGDISNNNTVEFGSATNKYVYKSISAVTSSSNDTPVSEIAAAGHIVTIVYDKYNKYDYDIKQKLGTAAATSLQSNSLWQDQTLDYYYPVCVKDGDDYYVTEKNVSTPYYGLTVTKDNANHVINYTQDSRIVYYVESDDMAGSRYTYSQAANYSSGGKSWCSGAAANSYLATNWTLGAGNYDIEVGMANRNYAVSPVPQLKNSTDDETPVNLAAISVASGSYTVKNYTNQAVAADEQLYFYNDNGTNASKWALDYVIVRSLPTSQSATITSAGMATYVPDYNLDFSSTPLKAYKVKVNTKGVATLTALDQVPAGTPVLLIGTTGDVPVIASAAAVSDNDLVAGTGAAVATTDGDYTNMILNDVGGNVGFYLAAGNTVAANRAYLHIATSLAPAAGARMMFEFEDEATGIRSIDNGKLTIDNSVYDLSGRRVAQPTKGLYIVNGKKVIVK